MPASVTAPSYESDPPVGYGDAVWSTIIVTVTSADAPGARVVAADAIVHCGTAAPERPGTGLSSATLDVPRLVMRTTCEGAQTFASMLASPKPSVAGCMKSV